MTKKEFVSMSLPYGLKVLIPEYDTKGCRKTVVGTVGAVYDDGSITCHDTVNACPRWYKPILYPVGQEIYNYIDWKFLYYIKHCLENHFDIAGLIEKGQAIDINTLKVNPYKKKQYVYTRMLYKKKHRAINLRSV